MSARCLREYLVYSLVVCGFAIALLAILLSKASGLLMYGVVQSASVLFLCLTKTRVGLSLRSFDPKPYLKPLLLFLEEGSRTGAC